MFRLYCLFGELVSGGLVADVFRYRRANPAADIVFAASKPTRGHKEAGRVEYWIAGNNADALDAWTVRYVGHDRLIEKCEVKCDLLALRALGRELIGWRSPAEYFPMFQGASYEFVFSEGCRTRVVRFGSIVIDAMAHECNVVRHDDEGYCRFIRLRDMIETSFGTRIDGQNGGPSENGR